MSPERRRPEAPRTEKVLPGVWRLRLPRAFVETMLYRGLTPQAKEELRELQEMGHERHQPDPMGYIEWRLLAWLASIVAFGRHAFRFRRGQAHSPASTVSVGNAPRE